MQRSERSRILDLGLACVLDLRATGERKRDPAWVPDGATYYHVSGMYDSQGREVDFSPTGIARLQESIESDPEHFMENLYASMAHDNPALKRLVDIVRKGELPVYFHCTAGKDRTGVAAATIYVLLGADDDTIVREFLLTNDYRAPIINMAPNEIPPDIPDDLRQRWAQINGVDACCLRAFLRAIDECHATREAWLEDEFGLTAPEIEAVRDRCLA